MHIVFVCLTFVGVHILKTVFVVDFLGPHILNIVFFDFLGVYGGIVAILIPTNRYNFVAGSGPPSLSLHYNTSDSLCPFPSLFPFPFPFPVPFPLTKYII